MKPTLLKASIVVVIICAGLIGMMIYSNRPLAKFSTDFANGRLDLSLKKDRLGDWVYIDASLGGSPGWPWRNGPRSVRLLGNALDLGIENPQIVPGERKAEFLLKFERKTFVFNADHFDVH